MQLDGHLHQQEIQLTDKYLSKFWKDCINFFTMAFKHDTSAMYENREEYIQKKKEERARVARRTSGGQQRGGRPVTEVTAWMALTIVTLLVGILPR
jgi:hypothetical protein